MVLFCELLYLFIPTNQTNLFKNIFSSFGRACDSTATFYKHFLVFNYFKISGKSWLTSYHLESTHSQLKPGLEIWRESILAMILKESRYENQFLSLNYVLNTTVTQNFDSRKPKRNSTPGWNHVHFLQLKCVEASDSIHEIKIHDIKIQNLPWMIDH